MRTCDYSLNCIPLGPVTITYIPIDMVALTFMRFCGTTFVEKAVEANMGK